jgi:hypothetical protein
LIALRDDNTNVDELEPTEQCIDSNYEGKLSILYFSLIPTECELQLCPDSDPEEDNSDSEEEMTVEGAPNYEPTAPKNIKQFFQVTSEMSKGPRQQRVCFPLIRFIEKD